MPVLKTIDYFNIETTIEEETFEQCFLQKVESKFSRLNSTLFGLDQATALRDVYKMGNEVFNQIIEAKRRGRDYWNIHYDYLTWIRDYYYYLSQLNGSDLSLLSYIK